jgi:hypothetical protein
MGKAQQEYGATGTMTEANAIDAATRRLAQALETLETAVERRRDADRASAGLVTQVQALVTDRSQLASDLDAAAAHARRLETTNREVARRLDAAMATIRTVLAESAP